MSELRKLHPLNVDGWGVGSRGPHRSEIRADIEGLRAISILAVLIYHFFPNLLGGGYVGVDVFFVISGFLITRTLLRSYRAGEPLSIWLASFYARRARRLLPNALLVLLVITVIGFSLLSDYAIKSLGADIFGSALYSVNFLFIHRTMDYLQWDETKTSIVLNFWSLSVEEQFYVVWPLVLFAMLACLRGSGAAWSPSPRNATLLMLLASLTFCLLLGNSHLTLAFFSTPARAWELLVGAHLAFAPATVPTATALRWRPFAAAIGIGLIVLAALTFSEDTMHPGWPTLLPVAGTAAVIAFGAESGRIAKLLASPLAQYLGSRSYSIYLWHWPVLILGGAVLPRDSIVNVLILLGCGLGLAEAAYRWIEVPARFPRGSPLPIRRVLVLAVLGSMLIAALGISLQVVGATSFRSQDTFRSPRSDVAGRLPTLQGLQSDLPSIYPAGCHLGLGVVQHPECRFGSPDGSTAAVLFGDSIAAQWFPALDAAAASRSVRLYSRTKSSCPSADITVWSQVSKGVYTDCDAWREAMFAEIARLKPATVFVSNLIDDSVVLVDRRTGRLSRGRDALDLWGDGLTRAIERLQRGGARVVVLRGTPKARPDILECLYGGKNAQKCELTLVDATAGPAVDVSVAKATGATLWDLTDSICSAATCPVVIPETRKAVYRDKDHLTASFAASLAPMIQTKWALLE